LTTKRGDSGSAGMLGKKCVIIWAPNLDTKSDQKLTQQQKSDKNWQKSTKSKIIKINKTQKTEKVTKSENAKTPKSENQKSEKVKKTPKNDPPLKMAKMSLKWPKSTLCEIRAAWSGVFSIPGGTTGPGFKAEIRPPLFLHIFDHFYHFSCFIICAFWCFLSFHKCCKLIKCWELLFFNCCYCNVIRPYCIIGERMMILCGGSPLIFKPVNTNNPKSNSRCRGDTQGRLFLYSRSPLSDYSCGLFLLLVLFKMSGRFTGRRCYIVLSFSPLWTGFFNV